MTAINGWRPAVTPLPHRTYGVLLFPVDHKVTRIEPLARLRLPSVIGSCRAQQFHPVFVLAGDQQFRIQVAGIDNMEARQQLFRLQLLMDGIRYFGIGSGARCRLYMCDQTWCIRFATLREVHLVPHPGRGVFLGIVRVAIIRGADHACSWWQPFGSSAPSDPFLSAVELLHPNPAQGLDRWNLTQPRGSVRSVNRAQQHIAIQAHRVGIGQAWLLTLRYALVMGARPIALQ